MDKLFKSNIESLAVQFVKSTTLNYVPEGSVLTPGIEGLRIFDSPLLAFGSARDPLFSQLRSDESIGAHFIQPTEWLTSAHTVISFFCPFTEAIRTANKESTVKPAEEWLHGRVNGQELIQNFATYLAKTLQSYGYDAVVPSVDRSYYTGLGDPEASNPFTSNWSERHVAYICGLGTFGKSHGLITSRGVAGRFGSIVTSWRTETDVRTYTDLYEFCLECNQCVRNCPVNAIAPSGQRNNDRCRKFMTEVNKRYSGSWPGCGKCQVKVPCESSRPLKSSKMSC